jgi:hypothetical protein
MTVYSGAIRVFKEVLFQKGDVAACRLSVLSGVLTLRVQNGDADLWL